MIAHISRARPALAVEYKGSVPSARETIAQGTLEGRPPGFCQQRLGGALLGYHVCLGPLMRWVHSAGLNTQVPISPSSPSTCFRPRRRAQSWKTGARIQSHCEFSHLEISFPIPDQRGTEHQPQVGGRSSKTNSRTGWGRRLTT